MSSMAAGRSSGVFTATAGTPLRARLARPTSAPAGATSMMPEAYEHSGRAVGLVTTFGFAVAFAISYWEVG